MTGWVRNPLRRSVLKFRLHEMTEIAIRCEYLFRGPKHRKATMIVIKLTCVGIGYRHLQIPVVRFATYIYQAVNEILHWFDARHNLGLKTYL